MERATAAVAPCRTGGQRRARLFAAAVDLLIVGSIDVGVVYFTLRSAGSAVRGRRSVAADARWSRFCCCLNGGYLTMFTAAGGQTIGKMAGGHHGRARADAGAPRGCRSAFGRSIVRPAYLASAVAARTGLPRRRSSAPTAARCTIDSPTRASSKRDAPRRLRRDGRLLRATFPLRPGTVGSAAGLVVYLLVWWAQSPAVEVALDRGAVRRRRVGRHDRRAIFRRHRSRARS